MKIVGCTIYTANAKEVPSLVLGQWSICASTQSPVHVDSPEVGENLQDHAVVALQAYLKNNLGYQSSAQGLGAIEQVSGTSSRREGSASGSGLETVSYWDPNDLSAEPTVQCYHVPIAFNDDLTPVLETDRQ
ncbi:hypothetical protein CA602_51825 [Paraburkholderia hospita]|nr:hypothetical protein CA602_51825 [Paraburkholderia hospita]